MVTTDAQLQSAEQDRLDFGLLARGISRFLRNTATEPPLTLAVSGDWGSGKSSLMALVCEDMHRHRSSTVWFNAWHHQKDEQFLAALLQAVRMQALPSSLTPEGWVFRLRLLWLRSRKHFVVLFLIFMAISATLAFMATHDTEQRTQLAEWVHRLSANLVNSSKVLEADKESSRNAAEKATSYVSTASKTDATSWIFQLLSGLAVLLTLRKALTAFGADPAVLLTATASKFRLRDADALTTFRARFREEFDEVTQCLPHRLLIVIDDLDRCKPESMLEVLEAVNFLVSSGRCFVMLGMATERVRAAIGLPLDAIATEMADPAATAADTFEQKRERRRAYADAYLEKLVNLEIPVPGMDQEKSVDFFPTHQSLEEPKRRVLEAWKLLLMLWPLMLIAIAIALGVYGGASFSPSNYGSASFFPSKDTAPIAATEKASLAPGPAASEPRQDSTLVNLPAVEPPIYAVPKVQPGDEQVTERWAVGIPAVLVLIGCIACASFRLFAIQTEVRDSEKFAGALRIWMPLVYQKRRTPRGLKRFVNRVRYLAMLQQPEMLDKSRGDALIDWGSRMWKHWRDKAGQQMNSASNAHIAPSALAEDLIVGLGALNEMYGSRWREMVVDTKSAAKVLSAEVVHATEDHQGLNGGGRWPPSQSQITEFERSLNGIRVPTI